MNTFPMHNPTALKKLQADLSLIEDLKLIYEKSDRERFSRDFYDYSPLLREKLSSCLADLVVQPSSVEAVIEVADACYRNSIPLTIRGSGTGNYGQCVPLQGGVVMLMGELRKIRKYDPSNGCITVEPGCLLRDLNKELFAKGRQLRLLPSTWRSASIGGFFAGGSGGIGSVRWGFLRDPGHLLGLEIVTLNKKPQLLQLNAKDSEALNHAYGTNGIITSLTISTTSLEDWQAVTIDCEDWEQSVDLLYKCSCSAIELHLCTLLESKILDCLPTWSGPANGKHRLLLLVSPDGVTTLERLAKSFSAVFKNLGPENDCSGSGLRELSWNHTTLHMRSIDSNWTYLQMLLPQPAIPFFSGLKNKWGEDLLWHLEGVRQQGQQRLAALPLFKWRDRNSLFELISDCKHLGAVIFNPHAITVEDGGLGVIDGDQVQAKRNYDPAGLLNPGKLKGWI